MEKTQSQTPRRWRRARAKTRPDGHFASKLEEQFALELERWKGLGIIRDWMYEPIKVKLAKRTYLTPDFLVQENDETLTFYETKGYMEEDANVKLKTAASKFPMFRWILTTKARKRDGGGWQHKEIEP